MRAFKAVLKTTSLSLALASAALVLTPVMDFGMFEASAYAQERQVVTRPKQPAKVAPQMTPENFKLFEEAQIEMEAENYVAANAILDKMLRRRGLSPYEKSVAGQLKGIMFFDSENYTAAIREYEAILATDDLPYQFTDSIQYTLAQMYRVTENFEKSLALMNDWLQYQANPTPMQWHSISLTYYQLGQQQEKQGNKTRALNTYRAGIPLVETAIEIARVNPAMEIRENWYQLQSAFYYSLSEFAKVRDILEIMLVKWPRPQYWTQLSAMYSELQEETKQLAVMDVAYRLGFITRETNLVNIAHLYNFNGAPYLTAQIMQEGMDTTKMVDDEEVPVIDPTDPKNLELLGLAYLTSKQYEKAAIPLTLAAAEQEEGEKNAGELYMQLSHIYSTLEDWEMAADVIQKAIDKGGLRREDQAYLYLGQAYFNLEQFKKAENAFNEARKDSRSRNIVKSWKSYIKSEKARIIRLADAGLR